MSQTIEIRHRWTNEVLFSVEADSLRDAVLKALKSRADLSGADLSGADLSGADLSGADLSGADLSRADLSRADLSRADLSGADLSGADLSRADLSRAKNLPSNALAPIRDDIRAILETSPGEVGGLLQALWSGKVDGSTYHGECACLVGTLANVRGIPYNKIPGLVPDSTRPAEQWFSNIRKGDTPVTNPAAAFACAIISEWMMEKQIHAPVKLST